MTPEQKSIVEQEAERRGVKVAFVEGAADGKLSVLANLVGTDTDWKSNEDPIAPDSDEGGRLRDILLFPDPRLTESSKFVMVAPGAGPWLQTLAADLIKTAKQTKAAGISAPQVGELARVIVIEVNGPGSGDYKVLVNPHIVALKGPVVAVEEGCLSFPEVREVVPRWAEVWVESTGLNGLPLDLKLAGVPAQAVQHEAEHLDGKLFIERLSMHRRDSVRTYMKQVNRKVAGIVKKSRGKLSAMEAIYHFKAEA